VRGAGRDAREAGGAYRSAGGPPQCTRLILHLLGVLHIIGVRPAAAQARLAYDPIASINLALPPPGLNKQSRAYIQPVPASTCSALTSNVLNGTYGVDLRSRDWASHLKQYPTESRALRPGTSEYSGLSRLLRVRDGQKPRVVRSRITISDCCGAAAARGNACRCYA